MANVLTPIELQHSSIPFLRDRSSLVSVCVSFILILSPPPSLCTASCAMSARPLLTCTSLSLKMSISMKLHSKFKHDKCCLLTISRDNPAVFPLLCQTMLLQLSPTFTSGYLSRRRHVASPTRLCLPISIFVRYIAMHLPSHIFAVCLK